jgi:hypothetical protein
MIAPPSSRSQPARVAIVCDYPEEGWASMDLTGAMVLENLAKLHGERYTAERICPPFHRRIGRLPVIVDRAAARNADRFLNRFHDYPRALGRIARRGEFDLYHVQGGRRYL